MTREIKAEQYQGRWANREILIIFSYTLFQMFLFATKLLSQTLMIRLTTKCLWVGAQERERGCVYLFSIKLEISGHSTKCKIINIYKIGSCKI